MAVRIVALLIPLAITLPQLQKNGPPAAAPQEQVAQARPASPPQWSWETRRSADTAVTRVVLESPALDAVPKVPAPQAMPKPAHLAPSAKAATPAKTSMRVAQRQPKRPLLQADCQPFAHCAPVVVGKVTPVSRRSL